jgi:hypothetical protein
MAGNAFHSGVPGDESIMFAIAFSCPSFGEDLGMGLYSNVHCCTISSTVHQANHPHDLTMRRHGEVENQPSLTLWTRPRIAEALSLSSIAYVGEIRYGKIVPHPRHWLKLAEFVGLKCGRQ